MTVVVWAGVDAGKASHHAAAIDADGRLLWSVRVANEQRRIELVARAGQSGGQRWAVDLVSPMASLLLAVLLTSGEDVVYVPRPDGFRPGRSARRRGQDRRQGRPGHRGHRPDAPGPGSYHRTASDELVVELARLTSHRADLMADWVRGVNRLREGSAEDSLPHLPSPCLWSLPLRNRRVPGRLGGVAAVHVQARARLGAVGSYRETGTSCHRPPFRLRLLPLAWPGALSPM